MKYLFVKCCVFFILFPLQASEIDTLLRALDNSILKRMNYFAEKENKIAGLKNELSQVSILEQKYALSRELMTEYSYYMTDTAMYYAHECLQYARILQVEDLILESMMDEAYLMCLQGMIPESVKILESINADFLSHSLKKKYFRTFIHLYHNYIPVINYNPFKEKYKRDAMAYIDEYMEIEKEQSVEYLSVLIYQYSLQKNYKVALAVVNQILERDDITPHLCAETLYNIGSIYIDAGAEYTPELKKVLAKASIMANELVMTKNIPLFNLAILLTNENKHVNRAYNYISIAYEDALKFSNVPTNSMLDKMNNTKQNLNYIKVKRQQALLRVSVIIIVVTSLIIIAIQLKLFKKNRSLISVNKKLTDTNLQLRDSNRIKDMYVIHFLNRYSSHLNKVEGYKNHIIRQLNTSQSNDAIKKEAMRSMNTNIDITILFSEFDKTVLELFPNFVEQVNGLLNEGHKYSIKRQGKLNPELRILAMLRLGITDNRQIGDFFRLTLQTVYNYRSKIKARLKNENTFDEDIKQICSY